MTHKNETKKFAQDVIDYLYSIIPNDSDHAEEMVMIQNMDMRGATVISRGDNLLEFSPKLSGAAEKLVKKHEEERANNNTKKQMDDLADKINKEQLTIGDLLKSIDALKQEITKNPLNISYHDSLIDFIIVTLNMEGITKQQRSKLCDEWADMIVRIFRNESYCSDINKCQFLFQQSNMDIETSVQNKIKKIVLECILKDHHDGIISQLAEVAKRFLQENESFANIFFNTIVKIAEDRMNKQKYYFKLIQDAKKDETFKFIPNIKPLFEKEINQVFHSYERYSSHESDVIEEYLIKETEFPIVDFNIDNYEITTLCLVSNCGMKLTNKVFRQVIQEIIQCIVKIYHYNQRNDFVYNIIDSYHQLEIRRLFQKQLIQSNDNGNLIIDILFENIDFSSFTQETIDFYNLILCDFVPEFFDSHSNADRRKLCKDKLLYLNQKIDQIENENVKRQLSKILILSAEHFGWSDWSKINTTYSYSDKRFLNHQFEKYGNNHLRTMLYTIYKLHIDELIPEILISLNTCLKSNITNLNLESDIEHSVINQIIIKSFLNFSDKIKLNADLTNAFESILEMMISMNDKSSAIILDRFRLH